MMIWSNFSQSMWFLAQRSRVLLEFRESFLQPLEGVPHSALDGVLRRFGDHGDLLEGEIRHVPQQEDLPLLARQGFDRGDAPYLDLVLGRRALGRRSRSRYGALIAERRLLVLGSR